MPILDGGSSTAGKANVDSNYNLQTNLPFDTAAGVAQGGGKNAAGITVLAVESDQGTVTGTRSVKKLTACEDGALNVAQFTRLFTENFPGSALNSALWTAPVTTMTVTVASNFLNLNAGLSTASAAVARVQSYRSFPIDAGNHTIYEIVAQFAQTPVANNITEWGCGIATGVAAPTDGAFFRMNAAGEFRCVINNNGSEVQSGTLNFSTLVGANVTKEFYIIFNDDGVQFFIGSVLVAEIALPTAGGTISGSQQLPILLRTYNSAATSAAQVLKVGVVSVRQNMTDTTKLWSDVAAGGGANISQGLTGQTMGTTALYTNNMAVAGGTAATNTLASLGVGLGGQFSLLPTLTAGTDGIISSYLNPLGTAAIPGRTLYIKGVKIQGIITVILAGGPIYGFWSLAYGHNAVSLATAEAATTKAPRRIPLGFQTWVVTAAVGTRSDRDIDVTFEVPVIVQPGEYIQTVLKNVGTVTTTGAITFLISFNGYAE